MTTINIPGYFYELMRFSGGRLFAKVDSIEFKVVNGKVFTDSFYLKLPENCIIDKSKFPSSINVKFLAV